jgi:16S rRNA A1518/A1519 N6-dimethyltransferase RsmA/KsgA/DIM1 with predicted DNA glycosylase/AP lyase activity
LSTNDDPSLVAASLSEVAQLPFALDIARLDQHLLVSAAAVERLIYLADIQSEDVIADVGSGTGLISAALAQRARKVLAIEIDSRFEPILRRLENVGQGSQNIEIYICDFLDADLSGVTKIVANPPFGLLEPMLRRLCDTKDVRLIALVLGQQSADVLRARIGAVDCTRLTLLAQAYFDVSAEATLARTDFYPPPRTDASIVLLRRSVRSTCERRALRILARAATFKGGTRVRDVAATVGARSAPATRRIQADQLTSPGVWGCRLQRLSNIQLSVLAADFVRLVGRPDEVGFGEPTPGIGA